MHLDNTNHSVSAPPPLLVPLIWAFAPSSSSSVRPQTMPAQNALVNRPKFACSQWKRHFAPAASAAILHCRCTEWFIYRSFCVHNQFGRFFGKSTRNIRRIGCDLSRALDLKYYQFVVVGSPLHVSIFQPRSFVIAAFFIYHRHKSEFPGIRRALWAKLNMQNVNDCVLTGLLWMLAHPSAVFDFMEILYDITFMNDSHAHIQWLNKKIITRTLHRIYL